MSAEVRKLPYLSWYDPDAWMEKMSGSKWFKMINKEQALYDSLLDLPEVAKLIPDFSNEMKQVEPMSHLAVFTIGGGVIKISLERGGKFKWSWAWESKQHEAYDIDVKGQTVWYIVTENEIDPYKRNAIICETIDNKVIWKKDHVAQQVFVRDGLCYYVKVEDYFRTIELCCCNAYTGANERLIYREKDKRCDLFLIATAYNTLYLKSVNAGKSRCWRITHDNFIPLDTDTDTQLILGRYPDRHHGEDQRIVIKKGSKSSEVRGDLISKWKLPDGNPEYISLLTGIVIIRKNGECSLWQCSIDKKPKLIFGTKLAEITPNHWNQWEGDAAEQFLIESPIEPPYSMTIMNGRVMALIQPFKMAPTNILLKQINIQSEIVKSEDGTSVHFSIVSNTKTPRGLLVYGYGAYGSSTNIGWVQSRWLPLLKRGWAISFAFVRGGGDQDEIWANAARLTNRYKSIEDFEAVIRQSQKITKLSPCKTVIFGRSAGGLLVGAVAARHPYGDLAGAVFAEVPYVDVLRTTTNPDLPLTIGEYEEFGNPLKRVEDFAALLKVSPVDMLTCDGAPGVFVLLRTGLKDQQVYPYEPYKFIKRLRGQADAPSGKYIAYEAKQAHRYQGPAAIKTRAEDMAILEAWLRDSSNKPAARLLNRTKKNRSSEYKKKMTSYKKSNKNMVMGGKKNMMMGGKKNKTMKGKKAHCKKTRKNRRNNKK